MVRAAVKQETEFEATIRVVGETRFVRRAREQLSIEIQLAPIKASGWMTFAIEKRLHRENDEGDMVEIVGSGEDEYLPVEYATEFAELVTAGCARIGELFRGG